MKRLVLLTTMVVLASAATAWCGEERNPGSRDKPAAQSAQVTTPRLGSAASAWGRGKPAADGYIESIDKVVNLSDAQKKAIKDIFAAREKATSDFRAKNAEKLRATLNAMTEAFSRRDHAAIARANKEYQAVFSPLNKTIQEANQSLENVLTPQQKAKQKEHQFAVMLRGMTAGVKLSDEQMKKLRAAWDQGQKGNAEPPYASWLDTLRKVVTAEQKEAMKKAGGFWIEAGGMSAAPRSNPATPEKSPSTEKKPVGWKTLQLRPGQNTIEGSAELKPIVKIIGDTIEFKSSEKPRQPLILFSEEKAGWAGYWLGVSVSPAQGLLVGEVAPGSPAAKAGLKQHDVLVRANGKPLKTVAELVELIQKAKGSDLVLDVFRNGNIQKIVGKPAKRPAEQAYDLRGLFQRPQGGQPAQSGAKITPLPGGGYSITIEEKSEGQEGVVRGGLQTEVEKATVQKALQEAQQALLKMQAQTAVLDAEKAAKSRMRDKVKRQRELADEALKISQKLESLGDIKTGEAHELWERLERIEGELRRTFEPTPGYVPRRNEPRASMWRNEPGLRTWVQPGMPQTNPAPGARRNPPQGGLMPGAVLNPPAGGAIIGAPQMNPAPTAAISAALQRHIAICNAKAERLTKEGKIEAAEQVKHFADRLREELARSPQRQNVLQPRTNPVAAWQMPPGGPVVVREGREFQELRNQVQELRRQVEELKALVKKSIQQDRK